MNPAEWRRFAQQPAGIVTILLLALLLAFRVHACPMLSDADFVLPDTSHDCCHHQAAVEDAPPAANPPDCHDGPCLQALDNQGGFDLHRLSPSETDAPASALIPEEMPPDWLNRHSFPPIFTPAIGPSPLQRSRILRL